jgi:hypothetical protein
MSTPDIATRLLLASDEGMEAEARALAQQLDTENIRRQEEEAEILAAAKKIVQTDPEIGARTVIVVAGESWHRGVIGIVASKLVDAFHRPAIVLSIDGEVAYGSCRSIQGFDMLGALERCAPLMIRFGGHRHAAGLTLETARIRELRAAVNDVADETRPRRRRRGCGSTEPAFPRDHWPRSRPGWRRWPRLGRQPAPGVRGPRRRNRRWAAEAEGPAPRCRSARRGAFSAQSRGGRPNGTTTWPSTKRHST